MLARLRRYPWRVAGAIFFGAVFGLNLLAYRHARAMLTYSATGIRTPSPQTLSIGRKVQVLVRGVSNPRPQNVRSPADVGLPFETVRFHADDGTALEAWSAIPAKPKGTVLLFHGYAAARSSVLDEARAFYDLGYAVLPADFRGCGGSDGNATTLGYLEAADVAAAVRFVRSSGRNGPVVLYGQSMGGAAVLRSIAVLGVQADAVVLESVFADMLGTIRNRFRLMGVPAFPAAEMLIFWGGVHAGFSGFAHNPAEYARNCRCPTLVLHGSDDRQSGPDDARVIYDNLPGEKRLHVFPEAGHAPLRPAREADWQNVVESFLAQHIQTP